MLKKVLSILIAALLLFSALPLTAFAADADVADTGDNVIRDVTITIGEPAAGYSPSSLSAYSFGENYKIAEGYEGTSPIWWWSQSGDPFKMKDGDTFEEGKEYLVTIVLEANSGYVFADNCRAGVNGKTAWASVGEHGTLFVSYLFGRETEMIGRLDIETAEPKPGELPEYTSSIYNMDGKLSWITKWYCVTDGSTEMAPADRFDYGKQYELRIDIDSYAGYAFTDTCKAYVNSSAAQIPDQEEHSLIVSKIYTMPSKIDEVDVNSVIPPTAGYKPYYKAGVPKDAGYIRSNTNAGTIRNGIQWYDVEKKTAMKPDEPFEADKQYKIRVYLKPDNMHLFAGKDEISATVNGKEAAVVDAATNEAAIEYTFTCQPVQFILGVALNGYAAPVAGEYPEREITVADNPFAPAHYSVYEVDWRYKNEDGVYVRMADGERFEAGKEYRVCVTLISDYDYGYRFEYTGKRGIGQFDFVMINGDSKLVNRWMCYVQSGGKYFDVYAHTTASENPHGTTGDCEWEYDPMTETLTISGDGRMTDYGAVEDGVEYPFDTPWEEYRETMRAVVIGDGVLNVGKYAFADCYELEEVTIGTHVETIGNGAFRNTNISSIDLSHSVTSIGREAFSGCSGLSEVKLNNQIASFGDYAFAGTAVRNVTIPSRDVTFSNHCFGFEKDDNKNEDFVICGYPGSTAEKYADDYGFRFIAVGGITGDCWWTFDDDTNTLTIGGSGAMADCEGEEFAPWVKYLLNDSDPWHLVFDGNITYIGDAAFMLLPIEGNVTIPASCTGIGANAFQSCANISDINLDSVVTVGAYAFKDCTGLMTVNLSSAKTIGESAFDGCTNINNIWFESSLVDIGDNAFANCSNLMNLNIPKSVRSIGDGAFRQCSSLSDISFAEGSVLKTIGSNAFERCDIRTLTIPDSVITIGNEAFTMNQCLEWLTLGKALETIGTDAFYGANISEVTIHGAVSSIGNHAIGYHLVKDGASAHIAPVDSLDIYGLTGSAAQAYAATEDNFHFHTNDMNEGRTGDCTWYYDDTNYKLSIYGSGSTADYTNPDDAPWYRYHENIGEVVIGEDVTRIGKNAFNDILGVFVPENVDTIVDGAIGFDFNEEPIEGYKLYGYADSAAEEYADKYDHIRFKDVTPRPYNPDSGITGGDNIYWSFDGDTRILIIEPDNDDLTASINDFDFTANAPWSGVGNKAPWGKYSDKIKHIVIKDGVTAIGAYAFAFLSKANDIDLSATVASIGEGAFYGTGIDMLKVENPSCTIGDYAFGYGDKPGTAAVESYYPFDAVIGGYQGSPAEAYANANENVDFVDLNSRWLYDDETSVTVITTESDVELVVDEKNTGDVAGNIVVEINGEISYAYDISLQKDGETVQPEDDVTVKLPYTGEESDSVKVYRVENDGTLTDMNAYFFDGNLVFTTDHFSLYIVVKEKLILGDVDGDGKVAITDATLIQRYKARVEVSESVAKMVLLCGDIDGDGNVTVMDATLIQRYAARMEIPYPIGSDIE